MFNHLQPCIDIPAVHPALEHFSQLQRQAPSIQLATFLANFAEPKPMRYETVAEGVKQFTRLANSNPLDTQSMHGRVALYGSAYLGLHYNNDLVQLWNDAHKETQPINALMVSKLAPSGWDSILQDGYAVLIYKGPHPAQALDQLVKGPTVIDCGRFTQLSLWFGIRYLLGNERFNQCFGRAPFLLTQIVHNDIGHGNKAYSGNPLYPFLSTNEQTTCPSVRVKYIANTPLYPLKHPGGNYSGENCIVIDAHHFIFDPLLENTQGLTELAVLNLLRLAFNQEKAPYDTFRLSMYAKTPETIHRKLGQTYGQLIELAEQLADHQLTEEAFRDDIKQTPSLMLSFDLNKFLTWLQRIEQRSINQEVYSPGPIDHSRVPVELLNQIPFENKMSMDFAAFQQTSPQQTKLISTSKQFCHSIMAGESKLVILTGTAGIGKTASAVCAAKELATKGKRVAWISEVMVQGWTTQAKSLADLDACGIEIDKLLATNPDVVFLDDNNLAGFSGNLLLEKIYTWYVTNPGKGLFITSNEPIHFKNCYGYKLNAPYHYPPFCHYHSDQYVNQQQITDLAGVSLRSRQDGQSVGTIVMDSVWKRDAETFGDVELIPGFNEKMELTPIRQSLRNDGHAETELQKLSDIQRRWIHLYRISAYNQFNFMKIGKHRGHNSPSNYTVIPSYLTANPVIFEKTACKTIALEVRDIDHEYGQKKTICPWSMKQLISVLNFAHDQGGRQVILINQTSFNSDEELLRQIKSELPHSERERTWSRLLLLLNKTEESIFPHREFNDTIEPNTSTKKQQPKQPHHSPLLTKPIVLKTLFAAFPNKNKGPKIDHLPKNSKNVLEQFQKRFGKATKKSWKSHEKVTETSKKPTMDLSQDCFSKTNPNSSTVMNALQ